MASGTTPETLRLQLLPSTVGENGDRQYATSYILNDAIAIDAGSIGMHPDLDVQGAIRHVLITHSHADHIASLPLLLENTYEASAPPIEVWASDAVLACLQNDVFNDRVWPGLDRLSNQDRSFVHLNRLQPERPVEVHGLRVLPVEMDHTVPTLGFIVESEQDAVVIASDTGPTERIWELAAATPNLRAVFLEASFPNDMTELAAASMHLTPELFGQEIAKLGRAAAVYAVHLKPRFRERIMAELSALQLPNLEIGRAGKEYSW